ncbi:MAG: helix-turn-helix domain-containing protein [Candidatus Methanofastidiosia archaeon]
MPKHRTKFDDKLFLKFYKKGLTDREIAEVLGVSQSTVNYRRERLGLKSNYRRKTFSDKRFLELYNDGLIDKEIASILNVTSAAINYRRERLELVSNSKPIDMKQFVKLYYDGYPIETIAKKMKISIAKAYKTKDELGWKDKASQSFALQEGL